MNYAAMCDEAINVFTEHYLENIQNIQNIETINYYELVEKIKNDFIANLKKGTISSIIMGALNENGVHPNKENACVIKRPYRWLYCRNKILKCESLDEFIEHDYDKDWKDADEWIKNIVQEIIGKIKHFKCGIIEHINIHYIDEMILNEEDRCLVLLIKFKEGFNIEITLQRDEWVDLAEDVKGVGPDCYHMDIDFEFSDKRMKHELFDDDAIHS